MSEEAKDNPEFNSAQEAWAWSLNAFFPKGEVERYLQAKKIDEEMATYGSLHDFLANHPAVTSRLESRWRHESKEWEQRTSAFAAKELFRHLITEVYIRADLGPDPKFSRGGGETLLPGYTPEEIKAIANNCRTIKEFLDWAEIHSPKC